jgi:hypothetical protein
MKVTTILAIIALALGLSLGASSAQAEECTEVYFKLVSVGDPTCDDGFTVTTGWSIYVTTSPSSVSGGTCSGFTLDNAYANVVFFDGEGDCGELHQFACDIVATDNTLSGYYILNSLGGGCFEVCANCTP